jgi:hypothetical protein
LSGSLHTTAAITFPTGKADVYINKNKILPQALQSGRGTYTGNLGVDYTFDRDNGYLQVGAGYLAGLLFHQPTTWANDAADNRVTPLKTRIAWARTGMASKNNVDAVTADFASLFGVASVKQARIVHGFGLSLAIPLAENGYTEFLFQGRVDTTLAATQSAAQTYADSLTAIIAIDSNGNEIRAGKFTAPQVLARDAAGAWIVRESFFHKQALYAELTFSYSIELMAIDNHPMLIALACPVRIGAGRGTLYGFALTCGMKLPVW